MQYDSDVEADSFYLHLLQINRDAFAGHLWVVAYHALSGALYCALALDDKEKLSHVDRVIVEQQDAIKDHITQENTATNPQKSEPLALTLYTSLLHISNPRRTY